LCWNKRLSEDEANELLQGFIAEKVLNYQLFRNAKEGHGRFRAFLMKTLSNFVVDHFRRRAFADSVHKQASAESARSFSPTPSAIAEAAWARELIRSVLEAMKRECEETGRTDIWTVFELRTLTELSGTKPASYESLAQLPGMGSPMQVANLLVTAKRMYARLLRKAVGEYEEDSTAITQELSDLRSALETPAQE